MSKPVVFLDLSCFIFHRFFAMQSWMKLSKQTFEATQMLSKYGLLFESNIQSFKKDLGFEWKDLYICKDCPRDTIWRLSHFAEYKKNRDEKKTNFDPSVFPYTYEKILPEMISKYGCNLVEYPCAEADDVIAVLKNKIRQALPDRKIVIITNDNDYLQLLDGHTEIINPSRRHIKERIPEEFKCCPALFVEWKVIKGDKSDNIPSIAKRLGDKTAAKLALDKNALQKVLDADRDALTQYKNNKKLIMFDELPEDIVTGIQALVSI